MNPRLLLKTKPQAEVNSPGAVKTEAPKTATATTAAAIRSPKKRRSQRTVELAFVLVIEDVNGVDAER